MKSLQLWQNQFCATELHTYTHRHDLAFCACSILTPGQEDLKNQSDGIKAEAYTQHYCIEVTGLDPTRLLKPRIDPITTL